MANTHANSASGVATGTNTETPVATISPAVAVASPSGEGVTVSGVVNITAGTGTTAVVVRVRRGVDATGSQVGQAATHTLAAGASASIPFCNLDAAASALSGTDQWTVTVQQTGGTAAGTVNYVTINAESCNAVE